LGRSATEKKIYMWNLDFITTRGKSDGVLIISGSAIVFQRSWDTV